MVNIFLPLLMLPWAGHAHQDPHRQFQYNSLVDQGTYNFAYDTGSRDPSVDAHSLRMEYRDANGVVRGRYGYTDPWGKLRVVEYEAGPNGYVARGDVGPDTYPHSVAPGLTLPRPNPAPTPLRMAGWDPARQPITERASEDAGEDDPQRVDQPESYPESVGSPQTYPEPANPSQSYPESVNPPETYYPRPVYTAEREVSQDGDVEVFHRHTSSSGDRRSEPLSRSAPLTIYNIDVNPDEIRMAAPAVPESRSHSRSATSNVASPQGTSDIVVTSPSITNYDPSLRNRPSYFSGRRTVDRAYFPRTTSGHFHPPQRASNHVHTPQRSSDHVHTPQRSSDHVHTPQRSSEHVHTPQRSSDHVHTPQRSSDHVHTPQRSSDHVHTPQRTPNYVYGQRIIDKPRMVNYIPATNYDSAKYYFN